MMKLTGIFDKAGSGSGLVYLERLDQDPVQKTDPQHCLTGPFCIYFAD
jgi:hypothetical protein